MFLTSVKTRGNFSPARNVLSTTDPEPTLFNLVRTNAPPLPGFTCWNSRMRQTEPSISTCIPFLNSFVETTSATAARRLPDRDELLRRLREPVAAPFGDEHHVLDPHASEARQVDPRLAADDVAGAQFVRRFRPHSRCLVDLETDPVAEAVA